MLLAEFQPHSLWHEATFTIAAQALAAGIATDFHTFQRSPEDVRKALERAGVNPSGARRKGLFRLLDSYGAQTGLGRTGTEGPFRFVAQGLCLKDWKVGTRGVMSDAREHDRLHIDDNDSLLVRANSEDEFLDFFQSWALVGARKKGLTFLHGFVAGVHSQRFYHRLESLVDGIFDFASVEREHGIEQLARARMLRGEACDTRWRLLGLSPRGVVRSKGVARSVRSHAPGGHREPEVLTVSGAPLLSEVRSPNAWLVLQTLTEAFLQDHRGGQAVVDDAGWRSLVRIARDAKISPSTLYPRGGVASPAIRELEVAGLIEARLTTGSRGRGGVATKLRVAYDNELVRSRLRGGRRPGTYPGNGSRSGLDHAL